MAEDWGELARRIDELAARVERLESRLSHAPVASPSSAPAPPIAPPIAHPPTSPPTVPPIAPPTAPPTSPAPAPIIAVPPRRPRWQPQPRERAAESAGLDWERLVGGRWYAVIGALVVVIGIGLFFKWAYDQGWFTLPPAGKCAMGVLFGLALIGAGEWARRRAYGYPAAGLTAAGIGALYVSTYAAHALYDLIGPAVTFILLAAIAVVGIALATRARLVVVGALSLVAGYLVPILLHESEGHVLVLPAYLLSLLALGLVLAGWLGRPFTHLRAVAWWGTLLLGTAWGAASMGDHPIVVLGFLAVVWAAIHGELLYSARKGRLAGARASAADPESPARRSRLTLGRTIVLSFSTTAWSVLMGVAAARSWGELADWMVPAAGFIATGALAHILAGTLLALRERPRDDAQRLGAAMAVQAGVLLVAAVALALGGWLQVIVWLALGVGAVAAGRWLLARPLDAYGLVVLSIAAGRLLLLDSWVGPLTRAGTNWLGLHFTRWSALVAAAGAAWLIAARLLLSDASATWRAIAVGAAATGAALLGACIVQPGTDPAALCLAWLALGLAIGFARPLAPGLMSDRLALVGTIAPVSAWLIAWPPADWSASAAAPATHPGFGAALLIVAAIAALALWHRTRRDEPAAALFAAGGAIGATLLAFAATSLEVHRSAALLMPDATAQRAAVSIWWGLFAFALLGVGFRRGVRKPGAGAMVRRAGLVLLGLATLKAVVADTAEVSQGARVASFIGLGLMMLAAAVVYARLAAALDARAGEAQGDRAA